MTNYQLGGYRKSTRLPRKISEIEIEETKSKEHLPSFERTFEIVNIWHECLNDGKKAWCIDKIPINNMYTGTDYVFMPPRGTITSDVLAGDFSAKIQTIYDLQKQTINFIKFYEEYFITELTKYFNENGYELFDDDINHYKYIIRTLLLQINQNFESIDENTIKGMVNRTLNEESKIYDYDKKMLALLRLLVENTLIEFYNEMYNIYEVHKVIPKVNQPYNMIESLKLLESKFKFRGLAWTTAARRAYKDACLNWRTNQIIEKVIKENGLNPKDIKEITNFFRNMTDEENKSLKKWAYTKLECPVMKITLHELTEGNRVIYNNKKRERTFKVYSKPYDIPHRRGSITYTHETIVTPIRNHSKFTKNIQNCGRTPIKGGMGTMELMKVLQDLRVDLKGMKTEQDLKNLASEKIGEQTLNDAVINAQLYSFDKYLSKYKGVRGPENPALKNAHELPVSRPSKLNINPDDTFTIYPNDKKTADELEIGDIITGINKKPMRLTLVLGIDLKKNPPYIYKTQTRVPGRKDYMCMMVSGMERGEEIYESYNFDHVANKKEFEEESEEESEESEFSEEDYAGSESEPTEYSDVEMTTDETSESE